MSLRMVNNYFLCMGDYQVVIHLTKAFLLPGLLWTEKISLVSGYFLML